MSGQAKIQRTTIKGMGLKTGDQVMVHMQPVIGHANGRDLLGPIDPVGKLATIKATHGGFRLEDADGNFITGGGVATKFSLSPVPERAAPVRLMPNEIAVTASSVTTGPKGRTTSITLPDGSTHTRTSKTRAYTFAVAIEWDRDKQIAAAEAELAKANSQRVADWYAERIEELRAKPKTFYSVGTWSASSAAAESKRRELERGGLTAKIAVIEGDGSSPSADPVPDRPATNMGNVAAPTKPVHLTEREEGTLNSIRGSVSGYLPGRAEHTRAADSLVERGLAERRGGRYHATPAGRAAQPASRTQTPTHPPIVWRDNRTGRVVDNPSQVEIVRGQVTRDTGPRPDQGVAELEERMRSARSPEQARSYLRGLDKATAKSMLDALNARSMSGFPARSTGSMTLAQLTQALYERLYQRNADSRAIGGR